MLIELGVNNPGKVMISNSSKAFKTIRLCLAGSYRRAAASCQQAKSILNRTKINVINSCLLRKF